ncbi:hypothetical protein ACQPU1_16960 [Clostridium paraputrificum]|uniref:hypothetical protein n=1 Tax=Clostridium TaxID=1485 RepID=UPI003D32ECC6
MQIILKICSILIFYKEHYSLINIESGTKTIIMGIYKLGEEDLYLITLLDMVAILPQ